MVGRAAGARMTTLGDAYASLANPQFVARYTAGCHCGAVQYEVQAEPLDAKICHCRNCQVLHGAPMQWAAIFHKKDVRLVRGVERLRFYDSTRHAQQPLAQRRLPCKVACAACGTLIADEGRRMWLAFPSLFDFGLPPLVPEAFRPTCHIFYAQRVLDMQDGLPKWAGHKEQSECL